MTLEEKIGQLVQVNATLLGTSSAEITGPLKKFNLSDSMRHNVGSTLNFGGVREMIALQREHLKHNRLGIPLMFMMDVIHGYRTVYPIPLALGASFDREIVAECSAMAAKEASAGGVQVTFAPMVDHVRDARWGRVMESCGEDTYLNCVMGEVQVRAFQGEDISDGEHLASCVKHFAGYGAAEAGKDYNAVDISERVLRQNYLPAYRACLDAGASMVMPSFNALGGIPAIANKWLLRGILRGEWGFDGVVISDYNAIEELVAHGVAADERDAARMAMECGCDVDMMSVGFCAHLEELVRDGVISESAVDEAALRVLELKERLGLFEDPYRAVTPERESEISLCPEHRDIARRAAESSAVLLKNDGVLPFSKDIKKVALVGPFASSRAIKGFWACGGRDEECVSVLEGVRALLPEAEITHAEGCSADILSCDESGIEAAVECARGADAVILCLGEPQDMSGEGSSRTTLCLSAPQRELARRVLDVNKNAAVVLFGGRPLEIKELSDIAPAILEMWFPGNEGGNAAARLLFGDANPSGKVSMSFPRAVGQCPIYYDRTSTGRPKTAPDTEMQQYVAGYVDEGNLPLYSFGHGLSYSSFVYESLTLDRTSIGVDDAVRVTVRVRNDSAIEGREVVQLYLRDLVASVVRPIQQLIGFEKITLGAHETREVTFEIREPMLRFYDFDCDLVSEPGLFEVSTGYADHLILTKRFELVK